MVDVVSHAAGPTGQVSRPSRNRLNWAIAAFALIVAVIIDGVILGGTLRQRHQSLADAALLGERIAQALSEHASQVVGRADQVLLGTIDAMAPRLLRQADDDAEVSAILNRYLAPLPYASGLVVVDGEGRIKHSASALSWLHEAPGFVPPACRGVEQAVAPLQDAAARPGTMLIAMTQLRENCRSQLVIARRVSDLPDQPAVVVAIVIEPSAFQRYYDQISGGLNGHAGLWTLDRRLAIGSSAIADQVGAVPDTLAVAEMIDASRQDHRPQTLAPEGDAVRLVSVHGVSRLPLIATVSMDRATLLARWRNRAFNAAVAGIVVTLGIVAMALALMRVAARIDDARNALRASEARFRDFAAASSDWYWEQDKDCRFTYMSPSASDHTTISPSNHMGRTRRELNPLGAHAEAVGRTRGSAARPPALPQPAVPPHRP
jgi:PAS domain-containing protein